MTDTALAALAPVIVLAASAVIVMLSIAVGRGHARHAVLTGLGLTAAFASLFLAGQVAPQDVLSLLMVDRYALVLGGLSIAAALVTVAVSYGYLCGTEAPEEYYVLVLTATLGAVVLAASRHFASLFLGIEIVSVSLFGLIAYPRSGAAIEAGIKYLVLSGAASAALVFGMGLLYARSGSLDFAVIGTLARMPVGPAVVGGVVLIAVGIGFKLSLVPFHMWTPDVYQGAPPPVAGFVATVSKGAVFALFLRYFELSNAFGYQGVWTALGVVAMATILVGNGLALLQDDLARLLAYSSVAHMGYLMVAFLAGDAFAVETVVFYLAAYVVATLAAFAVLAGIVHDPDSPQGRAAYEGLAHRNPLAAATLGIAFISLAGLPVSIGFFGKFYVIAAGIAHGEWMLVGVLIAGSIMGLFYYLRVLAALVRHPAADAPAGGREPADRLSLGVALALGATIVVFGVWPTPLVALAHATFL